MCFIIIIIIIIIGISCMQSIYTYIPETNHVSREHSAAAILMSLFMVLISLVPALVSFATEISEQAAHSLLLNYVCESEPRRYVVSVCLPAARRTCSFLF